MALSDELKYHATLMFIFIFQLLNILHWLFDESSLYAKRITLRLMHRDFEV